MYSLKKQASIAVTEATLQVNKFARKSRHLRIFSRGHLVKIQFSEAVKFISRPVTRFFNIPLIRTGVNSFGSGVKFLTEVIPQAPSKRLLFQSSLVALGAIFVTSLTPGGTFTTVSMNYSYDYINEYAYPGNVLVSDENGYLVKINPQTDDASRVGLTDFAVHTIEDGESLSKIASRYGVSVETIMWENGLTNANSIRANQKLLVPPVDGVSYKVAAGDSLEKIAKKYNISSDAIIAQNGLASEVVVKGESLFLPGARPINPPSTLASNFRAPTSTRDTRPSSYVNIDPATTAPAVGKVFIFPTNGKLTQGYRAGHYAFDIANTSKPAIWSAGGGTVIKVSTGTWGGGYGNHVIVDHRNGLKTLYAHMDSVNVSNGQWVNQGDVLGIMGNTGRVYGVTGIHLHWEVIQDGVKQYPGNYY